MFCCFVSIRAVTFWTVFGIVFSWFPFIIASFALVVHFCYIGLIIYIVRCSNIVYKCLDFRSLVENLGFQKTNVFKLIILGMLKGVDMGFFGKKKKKDELDSLPELPEDDGPVGLPDLNSSGVGNVNGVGVNGVGGGAGVIGGAGIVEGSGIGVPGGADGLPELPDGMNGLPEPIVSNAFPVSGNEGMNHNGVQRSGFDIGGMAKPMVAEPVGMSEHVGEPEIVSSPARGVKKGDGPIYIRLDKFQMTQQALGEIREKIVEVEKVLGKIKEIKEKEERELEEWERELGIMKSRIDGVDNSI